MEHFFPFFSFPFLFGGTFIEAACSSGLGAVAVMKFPFLFGGTFIEAVGCRICEVDAWHFPSFSEGLSLRRLRASLQEWR